MSKKQISRSVKTNTVFKIMSEVFKYILFTCCICMAVVILKHTLIEVPCHSINDSEESTIESDRRSLMMYMAYMNFMKSPDLTARNHAFFH